MLVELAERYRYLIGRNHREIPFKDISGKAKNCWRRELIFAEQNGWVRIYKRPVKVILLKPVKFIRKERKRLGAGICGGIADRNRRNLC